MKLVELAGSGERLVGPLYRCSFGRHRPRYQRIGHIQKLIADGLLSEDLRHRRAAERGGGGNLAAG